MPPAEFEPAIPVSERPQTHALDARLSGSAVVNCCAEINTVIRSRK
jgi:hypothetical protein